MMAQRTVQALILTLVLGGVGSLFTHAEEAPPAPRPFKPLEGGAPAYPDSNGPAVYSTSSVYDTPAAPAQESLSASRFQLDGTEEGSYASKDPKAYNATSTRRAPDAPASPYAEPQRPFRATAPVRSEPNTGFSLGLYGGANVAQEVDGTVTVPAFPGTVTLNIDSDGGVGATGGLKLRYTWPFDEEPIDQWRDEVGGEGLRISGALEFEPGYVGGKIEGTTAATTTDFDYHAFIFMVNAYLAFQAGDWRPYAGVGGGGAYVMADGNNGAGSDETMALAYQGIVGLDYFLSPGWSLFAEYKYLVFDGVDLYTASSFDSIEQHLFLMGIRKNF